MEGLCCCQSLSHVLLFVTPWTVAHQVPLSVGFSRQEHWSGLPFPSPGDLLDPGIKLMSPALAGRFFTTELPGKPIIIVAIINIPLQSHIENDRFSWAPFSESSGKKKIFF